MFERYTEKARRIMFFARYEASRLDAECIETEHLLLGILREDKALARPRLHRYIRSRSPRIHWKCSANRKPGTGTPSYQSFRVIHP